MKKLAHLFLPHPETHAKAKLLSWHFLLIYILLFLLLRVGLDVVSFYQPGVLGVDSQISVEKIISDTNIERQKMGLSTLSESTALNKAAEAKAANMFAENYWAHFSPSGKDPWGFINASGYRFAYAGENLARNFQTADDIVRAWMNSPSHRDNLLNPKYQDIGIAVVDGVLQGQKTTLVVQMFGRSFEPVAFAPKPEVDLGGQKIAVDISKQTPVSPLLIAGVQDTVKIPSAALNPYSLVKWSSIALLSLMALLLSLDWLVLKKRGVFRLSSHHLAHLSFLAIAGSTLLLSKVGEIL